MQAKTEPQNEIPKVELVWAQPGIAGAIAAITQHCDKAIDNAAPKFRKRRVQDTFQTQICRDHNGEELADIPIELQVMGVHHGTNEEDDPTEVDFGSAFVTQDIKTEAGEVVFRNGQEIELSWEELSDAQEEYLNQ